MNRSATAAATLGRMAGDAAVVVAAVVVSGLLFRYVIANGLHPLRGQAAPLIGTVTAGAAAVVALLSAINSRLGAGRSLHPISYAWGFYALVVMPISVLDAVPGDRLLPGAGAASAAVFCLLFALGLGRGLPRWWSGLRSVAVGVGLTLPFLVAALVVPGPWIHAVDSPVANVLLLGGWGLLAGACIVRGRRRRSAPWWRMGFGLVLITAARSLLLIGTPMQFATLRLIGFLLLVAAVAIHTRTLVQERRNFESEQADRLAAEERAAAEVSVLARQDGATCVVEVTDTGPGLDPTASTVGDGLGLALSTRLVEAAGGTLELRRSTRSPRGTTVLLRLPTPASARSRRLVTMPDRAGAAS